MYVGLGISKDLPIDDLLAVFALTAEEKKRINGVNMPGYPTTAHKQKRFLAYLWELAYELALDPSKDVSENPGFEAFLGVYSV